MAAFRDPPQRAPVTPRVVFVPGGVARPIDVEIGELLDSGERHAVTLVGRPGQGLTTALRHVAAAHGASDELLLLDVDDPAPPRPPRVVLRTAVTGTPESPPEPPPGLPSAPGQRWFLADWDDDDCLEYLRNTSGDRAAAAFAGWQLPAPPHDLRRWPGLCARVLDHMASIAHSPQLAATNDAWCALAFVLEEQLGGRRALAKSLALATFQPRQTGRRAAASPITSLDRSTHLYSETVRALLAAEALIFAATLRGDPPFPPRRWPPALAAAVGHLVSIDAPLLQQLLALATRPHRQPALLLSVLCAAEPGFRLPRARYRDLAGARLTGGNLRGRDLVGNWGRVDLTGADLDSAQLRDCYLGAAFLRRANLGGARSDGLLAPRLQADGLRAVAAELPSADLTDASLRTAQLDDAVLRGAQLLRADLSGASLRRCDLRAAQLQSTLLTQADLRDCRLDDARMQLLDLRTTQLTGAALSRVRANLCQLDDLDLAGLSAEGAEFSDCDLTGTRLAGGRLRGATFDGSRMADIDLEGADLRDATLRRCTFHLGSARSGLVDGTTAGEGSRTGFYTDESFEDRFQAPEDVRKANLRGCDLRGADLSLTDLYLVDLRGARLDPALREHARRCRAILDRSAR